MDCWKRKLFDRSMCRVDFDKGNIIIYDCNGTKYTYKRTEINGHKLLVYMRHDEYMGTVYDTITGYISPNMPKLQYAYNFDISGMNVFLKGISHYIGKFDGKTGYYFIKRDGFNVLFYKPPYSNTIIPKTRLLPEASTLVKNIIYNNIDSDVIKNIEEMVNDGYIPIFEVWGETLDKYNLVYGGSDVKTVKEIEGIDVDPVIELIALRINDGCDYPFIPPGEMIKIAKEYGLKTPPYEIAPVTFKKIREYYNKLNKIYEDYGRIVYEGIVVHVYDPEIGYGMLKLKPQFVLLKDVILKNIENAEEYLNKVNYEVSKILLDYDIRYIIYEGYQEVINQIKEYLSEDVKPPVLYKLLDLAEYELHTRITKMVVEEYPEICKEIPIKFKELKQKGYKMSKYQKTLINRIMGKCREKEIL